MENGSTRCLSAGRTCSVAKDFTALGGKVAGAGPGVEPEEREAVEMGRHGVKLLTLGVGKVDKDAVLQPGKTQIDRLQAASQQVIFEILDIGGSLGGGGIEPPGLGLVQKVIDKLNELPAGLGDFSDHVFLKVGEGKADRRAGCAWGRVRGERASWFSSGAENPRATAAVPSVGMFRVGFIGKVVIGQE